METGTSTNRSLVGTTLDNRYSITDLLGQGGMSTVYKARHLFLNRDVAIKIMQEHLANKGEGFYRFQREAQATAALNHPNIVTVTEFGVWGEQPYMVMDYLRGQSLAEYIKQRGRPEPKLALNIFKQVASALQHAHEKGILHRDLKPSNVMLVRAGIDNEIQCKVVDLGLARFLPSAAGEHKRLTAAGELVGSPFYMSPEQIRDEDLDARSDIYSLGCMMYEVLRGVRPFIDTNAISVLSMHLYEAPPPFGLVVQPNHIPPRLEAMVMKAMEKSRSSRFQTMKELVTQLEMTQVWDDATVQSSPTASPQAPVAAPPPRDPHLDTGSMELDVTGTYDKNAFTLRLKQPTFTRNKMAIWLRQALAPVLRMLRPYSRGMFESFEGKGAAGRRQKIANTRVLVAALGDSKDLIASADEDFKKYSVYYKNVERRRSMNAQEFLVLLSTDQFDIIHLHGIYDKRAIFKDTTGFHLRLSDVKRACDYAKVKMLWLASDNKLDWVRDNPVLEHPSFHLILTGRRGPNFPKFLSTLLSRMARGESMVSAWESFVAHAQYRGEKVDCRMVAGIADTSFLP
ncbi:MAG TPA: serine/threonine-protein kinase [Candidatus Obscuribacterales bacterium]